MIRITIIFLLFAAVVFPQDTTITQAYKTNQPKVQYPMVRPTKPPYPLIAGYLLIKEAQKGDPFAQHELGLRYLLGIGFEADTVKALFWINQAVEKNIPSAQFNYAIIINEGIGGEWDPFDAFLNFRNAAASGMPEAQYAYGLFFTDNLVVNRSLRDAYNWVKKSADAGFKPAEKTLKKLTELGVSFSVNDAGVESADKTEVTVNDNSPLLTTDQDLDYYEFAFDTVSVDETSESLNKFLKGDKEKLKKHLGVTSSDSLVNKSDTSGIGLIASAAESGSPEALLLMGRMHETGIGLERDSIKAVENYVRAYRLGAYKASEPILKMIGDSVFYSELKRNVQKKNPRAMFVWAAITALGLDYQITREQVFEFLESSAQMNFIPALIELGLVYYNGEIVERDIAKANVYWSRAVSLGSIEAKVRIAMMQIANESSPEKLREAVNALQYAADEGSVLAQSALAYCYENGRGVKQRKGVAARLYREAMYRGSEAAFNSLKRMYDDIRPADEEFQIY